MLTLKQWQQHNFSLGDRGERQAAQYLLDRGYQLLEANIRIGNHEVDIIAVDTEHNELVFVEVKSRCTDYYGEPSQAVDYKKIKSMAAVAKVYCQQHQITLDYRFDIITVISGKIEHYENVTWLFNNF